MTARLTTNIMKHANNLLYGTSMYVLICRTTHTIATIKTFMTTRLVTQDQTHEAMVIVVVIIFPMATYETKHITVA